MLAEKQKELAVALLPQLVRDEVSLDRMIEVLKDGFIPYLADLYDHNAHACGTRSLRCL